MNKKYQSFLISLITIFFLINFLFNSSIFIECFFNSVNLWFYNLFPSTFIFFITTDILNNYHFPYYLNHLFGKIINKIFKLPKESSYVIFMSLTSGFPGNSKLIKEMLDNNLIDSYDATKLLTMTHFSNPLFIINTIGIKLLNSFKMGMIVLIVHFLTNFLIGLMFRNIFKLEDKKKKKELPPILPFMTLLKNSIINTFKILINILGVIIFFSIINTTINQYLNLFPFSNMIVNGLLELTHGLSLLSTLNLSKIKVATLATFFISFGGISIHMQTMSILNKYNINYYIYLIARFMHAAISSILVYLLLINCYNNIICFI